MFSGRYYRDKFVYEKNGELFLFEYHRSTNVAHIMSLDENNELDIKSRSLFNNPIKDSEIILPLSIYLMNNGYTEEDFSNPFTRTKKILNEFKSKNDEKVLIKKK